MAARPHSLAPAILVSLTATVGLFWGRAAFGEPGSGTEHTDAAAPPAAIGARGITNLVESLASRNPAPRKPPPERPPVFGKTHSWAEQDRVVGVIKRLVQHAEEAWPELVAHLDDTRYSITYEVDEVPKNLSVGDVCKWIISDYISQAYFWHLPESSQRVFNIFNVPDVARHGNHALKEWCEARKEKKLFALQVEICRWAIAQVAELADKRDDGIVVLDEFSPERRRAVIAGIKGQIAELRESKRAVTVERFGARGPERWGLYTPERIEDTPEAPGGKGRTEGGGEF